MPPRTRVPHHGGTEQLRKERAGQHGGARTVKPPTHQDVKIRLYSPHAGQAELHRSEARFRLAVCGRRWGKTMGASNDLAKFCWENPVWRGLDGLQAAVPTMTWWVAPTYQQTKKAFDMISTMFAGAIAKKRSAVGQMAVYWKNGAITEFKSTERYDNLRGEGVRFMVIDEAAMIPKAAWEEVLRPMLSDTMGRALIISTPKGKNWFYALYLRGADPEQTEYESFNFPTASSPYIAASEVEFARETLPEDTFAQEYLGQFLDEAAGVFHGVDACIAGELEEYVPGHRYVIGWDIAKKADFSVVTVIDTDHAYEGSTQPRPHVVGFERFNTLSYTVQADRVTEICAKYKSYVLLDSTGLGDPVYDMLCARGVPCFPYVFTSRSKEMLIQNLAIEIQGKAITYPDIPNLLAELHSYQYQMSATGRLVYAAPEGEHDDCVISLALAAWAARHPAWLAEPVLALDFEDMISPI